MSKRDELNQAIEKEKAKREPLILKRDEINLKLQGITKRIGVLEKEVQAVEIETLMQLIREKGISPSEAATAIEAGYLDELIKKKPEENTQPPDELPQGGENYAG